MTLAPMASSAMAIANVSAACMDEGTLSFVITTRYSIGNLHTNENLSRRMTRGPHLSRPTSSAASSARPPAPRSADTRGRRGLYCRRSWGSRPGRRRRQTLKQEGCQVGPNDARWPTHSGGNTALKGWSRPNFWANSSVFLTWLVRRPGVAGHALLLAEGQDT